MMRPTDVTGAWERYCREPFDWEVGDQEHRAAEAAWNSPPPPYVRRASDPRMPPIPPIPEEHRVFLNWVTSAVGVELNNSGRCLDLRALWPVLAGVRAPDRELAAAIGRAIPRLAGEFRIAMDDPRLAYLRQIAERSAPASLAQASGAGIPK